MDFIIFSYDDFTILETVFSNEKTKVFLAKYKDDNIYILKEYLYDIIEESSKEISILTLLKNVTYDGYPITSTIHGFYYKKGPCFVLEYIPYTLCAFLKMFPDRFENITTQILHVLNIVHSYGILHFDLKSFNILVDLNGRIRIIDFGISELLFVSPNRDLLCNNKTSQEIQFPDNFFGLSFNIKHEDKMILKHTGRKSYNSDIYSLGQVLIRILLENKNDDFFVYHDDNLFIKKYDRIEKIDHTINPNFLALLKNMICINSTERYNTKECLVQIENTVPNDSSPKDKLEIFNMDNIIDRHGNKFYRYSKDEILNNKYELAYQSDMANNYTTAVFHQANKSDYSDICSWMESLPRTNSFITTQVLITAISLFRSFPSFSRRAKLVAGICIYASSLLYSECVQPVESILKFIPNTSKKEFYNMYEYIIINYNKQLYTILPVCMYIEYIIIELQKKNINPQNIESYLIDNILKWIKTAANPHIYPIWDILSTLLFIKYVYRIAPHITIDMDSAKFHEIKALTDDP